MGNNVVTQILERAKTESTVKADVSSYYIYDSNLEHSVELFLYPHPPPKKQHSISYYVSLHLSVERFDLFTDWLLDSQLLLCLTHPIKELSEVPPCIIQPVAQSCLWERTNEKVTILISIYIYQLRQLVVTNTPTTSWNEHDMTWHKHQDL